jgi:predicted anti-sigma-YlaC factor YlaD
MKCTDIRSQLTAYLDGELEDDRGSAVRGHLRTCEACRTAATDEAALRDGLRALPPLDPPASLWAGVQARLAQAEMADAERPAWRRTLARWMSLTRNRAQLGLAALAVATAVVVLVWHARQPGEEPSQPFALPTLPHPPARLVAPAPVPDATDVSVELASAPAHETGSYAAAADELLKLAHEARERWSDDRRQAFDTRVAELRKQIDGAAEGAPRHRAYRALIRYLQRAAVRDEITLADVGGAR